MWINTTEEMLYSCTYETFKGSYSTSNSIQTNHNNTWNMKLDQDFQVKFFHAWNHILMSPLKQQLHETKQIIISKNHFGYKKITRPDKRRK